MRIEGPMVFSIICVSGEGGVVEIVKPVSAAVDAHITGVQEGSSKVRSMGAHISPAG